MSILKRLWRLWQKFGRMLGDFIGRLILTIFYFTIFLPFGLITRLLRDPLTLRMPDSIRWAERTTGDREMNDARRLF